MLLLVVLLVGAFGMFPEGNLPVLIFNTLTEVGTCYRATPPCEAKEIDVNGTLTIYPTGSKNDIPVVYNISMKIHGQSTASQFEKQAYGFNIVKELGNVSESLDVELLNFTKERKFMVKGPFADESLMRDELGFELSRRMGRYASLYRSVEVYVAPYGMAANALDKWAHFKGLYILEEKYRRSPHRINITKQNASLADYGGWILGVDKFVLANTSFHPADIIYHTDHLTTIQIDQPAVDEMNETESAVASKIVMDYMNGYENALFGDNFMDPVNGYAKYLSIPEAVDYFLHTEMTRSVDAYRFSIHFYKDSCVTNPSDCKLKMGPVWDFDLSMGMCGQEADPFACDTNGWRFEWEIRQWLNGYNPPPTANYVRAEGPNTAMWFGRLLSDPAFKKAVVARWKELRRTTLTDAWMTEFVTNTSDHLKAGGAVDRNYERWPIMGLRPWPVRAQVVKSYDEEITLIKNWLVARAGWLDAAVLRPIYHLGTAEGTTCDVRDDNATWAAEGPDCIVGPSGQKCGGPFVEKYKCSRGMQTVITNLADPGKRAALLAAGVIEGNWCSYNDYEFKNDNGKCPGTPPPGNLFCNRGVCSKTEQVPTPPTSSPTTSVPTSASGAPTLSPSSAPSEAHTTPTAKNPTTAGSPTAHTNPTTGPPSLPVDQAAQGEQSPSSLPVILGAVGGVIALAIIAFFVYRYMAARKSTQHAKLLAEPLNS